MRVLIGAFLSTALVDAHRPDHASAEKNSMPSCTEVGKTNPESKRFADAPVSLVEQYMASQVQVNKCEERIRIGAKGDGGYIQCNDTVPGAEPVVAVLSLGIAGADDWGVHASKHWDAPVFQFDCFDQTVPPCDAPRGCNFFPKCIEAKSTIQQKQRDYPDKSFITFEDAVDMIEKQIGKKGGDMILKHDIETSEYKMFEDMPVSLLNRFQQITGEWHPNFWHDDVVPSKVKVNKYFYPMWTHPNDCCKPVVLPGGYCGMQIYEASFIRKKGLENKPAYAPTKLPLDMDRDQGGPHRFHLNLWPYNGGK